MSLNWSQSAAIGAIAIVASSQAEPRRLRQLPTLSVVTRKHQPHCDRAALWDTPKSLRLSNGNRLKCLPEVRVLAGQSGCSSRLIEALQRD